MISLLFLVCSTVTGECYSATSTVVYETEQACEQDAISIMERVYALQALGQHPSERAVFYCHNWGDPT